ncbi:amidohydrolase family protein [Sphaerisporangium sp. TRM90804]|uniref:amidohydrolase family protein n=1 Tax=Sphaerisporangium sp. TRM90804 TaxID=3031113 RepID=UPI00244BB2DF|nr:amidohydrolase family protein [Sphaerisporangium sp. TRM90804]MDH2426238.1 amidohydrolase family protein [Sphaerisporangium sp. TRM90804]
MDPYGALPAAVRAALRAPLVDHHCRGVRRDHLTRSLFETLITEARTPAPPGATHFDTPVGTAIRRWCGPVLGLDPHAPPTVYLARRAELGAEEANRRLLREAGVVAFLVDAGDGGHELLPAAEMGRLGGAAADDIVVLERVEEEVAKAGPAAVGYADALAGGLARAAARAVAFKSAIARGCGLDFDPARPGRGTVIAAAGRRLAAPGEPLRDPVLLRHLLWTAVDVARERGLPLQIATGYGEAGPQRSDPALMSGFLRALPPGGVPVVLLHCHPFHRQAAYLAGVFPHVYLDIGLGLASTAAGSAAVLGELLERVPYHKLMFSSGCRGVAETCHLGALCFRRGLARTIAARLGQGEWSPADAARVAHMIGSDNARRVYRL